MEKIRYGKRDRMAMACVSGASTTCIQQDQSRPKINRFILLCDSCRQDSSTTRIIPRRRVPCPQHRVYLYGYIRDLPSFRCEALRTWKDTNVGSTCQPPKRTATSCGHSRHAFLLLPRHTVANLPIRNLANSNTIMIATYLANTSLTISPTIYDNYPLPVRVTVVVLAAAYVYIVTNLLHHYHGGGSWHLSTTAASIHHYNQRGFGRLSNWVRLWPLR